MAADPLSAEVTSEELAELRRSCPVSRTERDFWYVARYDDSLAGMNDVHAFRASFPRPRRRGAAGGAVHQRDRGTAARPRPENHQFRDRDAPADQRRAVLPATVRRAVDGSAQSAAADRPGRDVHHGDPQQRDRQPARRQAGGLPALGGLVGRGRARDVPDAISQRARIRSRGSASGIHRVRRRPDRRSPRNHRRTISSADCWRARSMDVGSPTSRPARNSSSCSFPATRRPGT